MKKTFPTQIVLLLFLFIYMLLFTQHVFSATVSGIKLCLYTVIPTLLPFMILSNYVVESGLSGSLFQAFHKIIHPIFKTSKEGTYAFMIGLFCGFPMGVKTACDLYKRGLISKEETMYLSTIANNASPMFIIAFVVSASLHKPKLALLSLSILFCSNILVSLFTRRFYKFDSNKSTIQEEAPNLPPFSRTLDTSILHAMITVGKLSGYILIFSILVDGLSRVLSSFSFLKFIILGICEVTTGITYIATNLPVLSIAYPLILAATAMGGLCVAAQTQNIMSACNLSMKPYLLSKFANMIITFVITSLLLLVL